LRIQGRKVNTEELRYAPWAAARLNDPMTEPLQFF